MYAQREKKRSSYYSYYSFLRRVVHRNKVMFSLYPYYIPTHTHKHTHIHTHIHALTHTHTRTSAHKHIVCVASDTACALCCEGPTDRHRYRAQTRRIHANARLVSFICIFVTLSSLGSFNRSPEASLHAFVTVNRTGVVQTTSSS